MEFEYYAVVGGLLIEYFCVCLLVDGTFLVVLVPVSDFAALALQSDYPCMRATNVE